MDGDEEESHSHTQMWKWSLSYKSSKASLNFIQFLQKSFEEAAQSKQEKTMKEGFGNCKLLYSTGCTLLKQKINHEPNSFFVLFHLQNNNVSIPDVFRAQLNYIPPNFKLTSSHLSNSNSEVKNCQQNINLQTTLSRCNMP